MATDYETFEDLGRLIRETREERRLSLRKLGSLIGVTGATIHNWEKGKVDTMKLDHAQALAKQLGIEQQRILKMLQFGINESVHGLGADPEIPPHHLDLIRVYGTLPPEVRGRIRELIEVLANRSLLEKTQQALNKLPGEGASPPLVRQVDESREPKVIPKARRIRR
ncbi:MAG TPA: helix-turn-helix transcriptional regulator [Steroidobacteraceae bacterium]|jgi:transcriptional regulator with XRE-family HTH domain